MPPIHEQSPDDVFQVHNPGGSSPLLIGCDHAENRIPEAYANLGLADEHLEKHIAYDIGAKNVALLLSEMFDAPAITGGYSRLMIDLNRHLDDPSLIVETSDGIPIPGNQDLDESERSWRIDQFFHPYHNQYAAMVDEMADRTNIAFILSVHSFTPTLNGIPRPWDYGVLWTDAHANLAKLLLEGFSNHPELEIGSNEPYHAGFPQGYAQVAHGEHRGVEMALIEIRQDLVDTAAGQEAAADKLYSVLKPLVHPE